jgi:hypothetical protein
MRRPAAMVAAGGGTSGNACPGPHFRPESGEGYPSLVTFSFMTCDRPDSQSGAGELSPQINFANRLPRSTRPTCSCNHGEESPSSAASAAASMIGLCRSPTGLRHHEDNV